MSFSRHMVTSSRSGFARSIRCKTQTPYLHANGYTLETQYSNSVINTLDQMTSKYFF